jgi:hypothetical protein
MSQLIGYGPCWSCGRLFTFDPDLVPSLPIDPETNRPVDVDEHGEPGRAWTAEEYARTVKQPICEACIGKSNDLRAAKGQPPIPVLPGAYLHG